MVPAAIARLEPGSLVTMTSLNVIAKKCHRNQRWLALCPMIGSAHEALPHACIAELSKTSDSARPIMANDSAH